MQLLKVIRSPVVVGVSVPAYCILSTLQLVLIFKTIKLLELQLFIQIDLITQFRADYKFCTDKHLEKKRRT